MVLLGVISLTCIDYGATIISVMVPDRNGVSEVTKGIILICKLIMEKL